MSGAGEALQAAAMAALQALDGVGVHDGPPIQAAAPYAMVDAGFETDWSHKSGIGREVRIAVTLVDKGERPARLRRLAGEAEALLAGMGGTLPGWRVVTMRYLGSRLMRTPGRAQGSGSSLRQTSAQAWTAVIEFRARMLAS